ncbi:hypothetical protein GCM10007161_13290 [Ignatzschineria indica]|uniref:Uncharacterized protein n=2 Tax=Ignatzschineria TaxID=112008 RepID=A0A2U2AQB9_9GAMM|nr:hypothetical protein DC082_06525 [Ignatzschineria indica]PWD85821.1 hypothetical protein DC077_07250 [Ignatzschineria cameli]PWD89449.1 hypothetical protein DC079_06875 [Ignatzschineria cameli]PWD90921.1 hypothetical protein DC081_06585 [Ignatzschineria cameli]PWD91709.1 hypothetical protein DC078_06870 [Ignatzschineria cameli]
MLNLNDMPIEIPCPDCSHKISETIGNLKKNPTLECPVCGFQFKVNADELKESIKSAEMMLNQLRGSLKNFKI